MPIFSKIKCSIHIIQKEHDLASGTHYGEVEMN